MPAWQGFVSVKMGTFICNKKSNRNVSVVVFFVADYHGICYNISSLPMPKVVPDVELQTRLNAFIKQRGISIAKAAKEFEVDRVSLWRFSSTGRALDAQRTEYREALNRATQNQTETPRIVALPGAEQQVAVEAHELERIRQICESVLKLVDAYEAALQVGR
ncbi:hypothetical protein V7714_17620 [Chitinimonas sp. JJ19]